MTKTYSTPQSLRAMSAIATVFAVASLLLSPSGQRFMHRFGASLTASNSGSYALQQGNFNATCDAQLSSLPESVVAGKNYPIALRFQNTSNLPWERGYVVVRHGMTTAVDTLAVRLAQESVTIGMYEADGRMKQVYFADPSSFVKPNDSTTFHGTLIVPPELQPGPLALRFKLKLVNEYGIGWSQLFGGNCIANIEVKAPTQCSDGKDNDGDGEIDLADDSCTTETGDQESQVPACSDGIDNDGDRITDFPEDKGCADSGGEDERESISSASSASASSARGEGHDGFDARCVSANIPSTVVRGKSYPIEVAMQNQGADLAVWVVNASNSPKGAAVLLTQESRWPNWIDRGEVAWGQQYLIEPGDKRVVAPDTHLFRGSLAVPGDMKAGKHYLAFQMWVNPGSRAGNYWGHFGGECRAEVTVVDPTECSDGKDNDGDGAIDMADQSCVSEQGTSERPIPACNDGNDNDHDTFTDFPDDKGCSDAEDDEERNPQCNDLIDNDGDGEVDFQYDISCARDPYRDDELHPAYSCQDGIDNDGDGLVDFGKDPGCANVADPTEESPPACSDGIDNDGDRLIDLSDPVCTSADGTLEDRPEACRDGQDNDGDELVDYPTDSGCTDTRDTAEENPVTSSSSSVAVRSSSLFSPQTSSSLSEVFLPVSSAPDSATAPPSHASTGVKTNCSDGHDNEGDSLIDYPEDPGCSSPLDTSEQDGGDVPWTGGTGGTGAAGGGGSASGASSNRTDVRLSLTMSTSPSIFMNQKVVHEVDVQNNGSTPATNLFVTLPGIPWLVLDRDLSSPYCATVDDHVECFVHMLPGQGRYEHLTVTYDIDEAYTCALGTYLLRYLPATVRSDGGFSAASDETEAIVDCRRSTSSSTSSSSLRGISSASSTPKSSASGVTDPFKVVYDLFDPTAYLPGGKVKVVYGVSNNTKDVGESMTMTFTVPIGFSFIPAESESFCSSRPRDSYHCSDRNSLLCHDEIDLHEIICHLPALQPGAKKKVQVTYQSPENLVRTYCWKTRVWENKTIEESVFFWGPVLTNAQGQEVFNTTTGIYRKVDCKLYVHFTDKDTPSPSQDYSPPWDPRTQPIIRDYIVDNAGPTPEAHVQLSVPIHNFLKMRATADGAGAPCTVTQERVDCDVGSMAPWQKKTIRLKFWVDVYAQDFCTYINTAESFVFDEATVSGLRWNLEQKYSSEHFYYCKNFPSLISPR